MLRYTPSYPLRLPLLPYWRHTADFALASGRARAGLVFAGDMVVALVVLSILIDRREGAEAAVCVLSKRSAPVRDVVVVP